MRFAQSGNWITYYNNTVSDLLYDGVELGAQIDDDDSTALGGKQIVQTSAQIAGTILKRS